MRLNIPLSVSVIASAISTLAGTAGAAAWTFEDATLSISSKGSGAKESTKQDLKAGSPLPSPVQLGSSDSLKILLKASEGKTPKRPHQAFLTLQEQSTGLEDSYPLTVKENGKAIVELTYKELPAQFLSSNEPLKASLVLASFGSTDPLDCHLFDLLVALDEGTPVTVPSKPLRYGKLDEIRHIFKAGPRSPPQFITNIFVAQALITLPALIGIWVSLGANLNHLPQALSNAPLSHAAFLGSILALEGIFFLYYTHWKLYQMLPAAGAAGVVAFLSGSRALSEVQSRRLVGKR